MFTRKTKMLIGSLLFVITVIITARFAWNTLVEWITDTTLPLIQSTENTQELLQNAESSTQEPSQISHASESTQVTTTGHTISTGATKQISEEKKMRTEQKELPKKGRSRTARRRKKENTETNVELHTIQTTPKPEKSESLVIKQEPHASKPEKQIVAQGYSIPVTNKIDADTLAVKHWTGTYSPTKLEITLNGVPFNIVGNDAVALDALQQVPIQNNTITVQYAYEFMNGMRKGSDTLTYTVSEQSAPLELRFSWDTAWHVELDGAQRTD